MLGWELMPWQAYVLLVGLEVQSEAAGDEEPGMWAYLEVAVTVQRQSGKTTLLTALTAHRADLKPRSSIWMTAQDRGKAVDRWTDLTDVLLASPLAPRLHRKVSHSHEVLAWKSGHGSGSKLRPFAPGRDGKALHGETPDLVPVDEVWAFRAPEAAELRGAYEPGFSTTNGQAWLLSTAGKPWSSWLNELRRRGRAAVEQGERTGLAYFEWSVPAEVGGIPVDDLDDETLLQLVLAHHPAAGVTVRPIMLRKLLESAASSDDPTAARREWLRAYGNHPGDVDGEGIVDTVRMSAALADDVIPGDVEVTLGFEADLEGEEGTVVAAWRDPETGHALTEVLEWREGTSWLPGYLTAAKEKQAGLVVHLACGNSGPTRDVADRLEQLGHDVTRLNGPEYSAASSRWIAETTATREGTRIPEPTCHHDGHPKLLDAVKRARLRRFNGSLAITRGEAPVTALPATVAALWGADHPPESEPDLGSFAMH